MMETLALAISVAGTVLVLCNATRDAKVTLIVGALCVLAALSLI